MTSPMKYLPFIIVCLLLVGCSSPEPSVRCEELFLQKDEHHGACFRNFWRELRQCYGPAWIGSGCILRVGQKGDPWCYSENCAALHAQDPIRFQLWP